MDSTITSRVQAQIDQPCVTKGNVVRIRVDFPENVSSDNIQIHLWKVGVLNPQWCLTTGATRVPGDHPSFEASIDTSQFLDFGFFELVSVVSGQHLPADSVTEAFHAGHNFARAVFQISDAPASLRSQFDVLQALEKAEQKLMADFLSPVDARSSRENEALSFSVFLFVKGLLITTRMRFDRFEIVPTGGGIDSRNAVDFINAYFRDFTTVKVTFDYEHEDDIGAQRSNPVCVAQFPNVLASSADEAVQYCVHNTRLLVLALALSRDAGGEIFDIVVMDHQSGTAQRLPLRGSYKGNLATGIISGEDPHMLQTLVDGLQSNEMNRFLAGLYREARRETSHDFQYVRYWQILETMAEGRNYDEAKPLLDYSGKEIMDGDKVRRVKGAVSIVFNMLREAGIRDLEDVWKHVNIWCAFRNAVAHHGSVSRFAELDHAASRRWAAEAYSEIESANGHDVFLWRLKEHVKSMLVLELTRDAH
ncbi:hypothetical protein B0G81_3951 [Paraburkholderia sp. BL6665CI2N2]|uniref:methylamine utilization protein MauJ n=1 Tax=Paraburkholderia sp. BL6665CI2N2 TaxID=1938806 RepID=UPI0010E4FE49|nr:methylamine utilization protein MauJ [Paraburkholderia sp. BL6665CI2N2]TDY23570.1 hypothetical protein B0G81_3951 [Paraburkholderia sp. BL6665CI2N2]